MPLMIAAIITAIVFTFQSFAHASPHPRGSTFAATVEDGTPRVVRVKKTELSEERIIESDEPEEFLDSMAQPASAAKAPAPKDEVPQSSPSDESIRSLRAEVANLKAQMAALKPAITENTPPNTNTKDSPSPSQIRTAGERVPPEHLKEMGRRLSAASQILKKYGIAYDYRVMTLKDFVRIEARLSKALALKNQEESAPSEETAEN